MVTDCNRSARARGYCTRHYQQWKAHGDPTFVTPKEQRYPDRVCTVEGCSGLRQTSRLYCEKHRARMRRHGDVAVALKDHTPAQERWKTSYVVDETTGCWLWNGPLTRGYGFIQDGAENRYMAHRFVWQQINGPIPEGLVLDHDGPNGCHNRRCVNPAHLDPVVQAVNCYRGGVDGGNAAKTQCDHGHDFTPENTYYRANGWRYCRACSRRRMRDGRYRQEYVYLYLPGHPIADRANKIPEHRFVLYEAIGPGPHPCHWCEKPVDWGGRNGINVDHLNGEPSDNRRENLVPSCQSCNKRRAAAGNRLDWRATSDA